jgi:hypothetical protein
MRSFQLHSTLATPKTRSRKRTYSYHIAMKTLRFLLINRAARLAPRANLWPKGPALLFQPGT